MVDRLVDTSPSALDQPECAAARRAKLPEHDLVGGEESAHCLDQRDGLELDFATGRRDAEQLALSSNQLSRVARWDGWSLRFLLTVCRLLQNQGPDPITVTLIDRFDSARRRPRRS